MIFRWGVLTVLAKTLHGCATFKPFLHTTVQRADDDAITMTGGQETFHSPPGGSSTGIKLFPSQRHYLRMRIGLACCVDRHNTLITARTALLLLIFFFLLPVLYITLLININLRSQYADLPDHIFGAFFMFSAAQFLLHRGELDSFLLTVIAREHAVAVVRLLLDRQIQTRRHHERLVHHCECVYVRSLSVQ